MLIKKSGVLLPVLTAALLLSCTDPTGPATSPETAVTTHDVTANFNPQPEPPGRVVSVSIVGDPLTRMTGELADGSDVLIIIVGGRPRGRTLHTDQRWEIIPPVPGAPSLELTLSGIIAPNGRVVLNGATEDGGNAHFQGTAEFLGGGDVSIGGELMFNPQPEPPAP